MVVGFGIEGSIAHMTLKRGVGPLKDQLWWWFGWRHRSVVGGCGMMAVGAMFGGRGKDDHHIRTSTRRLVGGRHESCRQQWQSQRQSGGRGGAVKASHVQSIVGTLLYHI